MLTTLPFAGFYNTVHDSECDEALSQMFADSAGNPRDGDAFSNAWDHINWTAVHTAYAKDYAERFASEFKLGRIRFDELNSPREYNFETDRIFVRIGRAAVRRIWREVDREAFAKHCRDTFTSRSGFISHYRADYREWGSVDKWDHNQIGALLTVWAEQNTDNSDGFDSWAEFALMEDCRGSGYLDNWLCDAMDDEGKRLLRIADYLREREDRQYRYREPFATSQAQPSA